MISTVGLGLMMFWYSSLVLPKIEKYTQSAAIEFYEKMQGENVYIHTFKFKSYADYFYARKSPVREEALEGKWLLEGPIDKTTYYVTKVNKMTKLEEYPDIEFLYQKGGFAFYKREP